MRVRDKTIAQRLREWDKEGYSATWMAERLDCSLDQVLEALQHLGVEYDKTRPDRIWPGKVSTVCWYCARAVGADRCVWHGEFKAVKGWEAEETLLEAGNPSNMHSYRVISCPQFEEG